VFSRARSESPTATCHRKPMMAGRCPALARNEPAGHKRRRSRASIAIANEDHDLAARFVIIVRSELTGEFLEFRYRNSPSPEHHSVILAHYSPSRKTAGIQSSGGEGAGLARFLICGRSSGLSRCAAFLKLGARFSLSVRRAGVREVVITEIFCACRLHIYGW
jgi:hypothetical protein